MQGATGGRSLMAHIRWLAGLFTTATSAAALEMLARDGSKVPLQLVATYLVEVDAADDIVQPAAVQQRLHLPARQRRDMRLHPLHAQP
jgi:hypothetical protein